MIRRQFLRALTLGVAGLVTAKSAVLTLLPKRRSLSFAEIVAVSYDSMVQQQKHPWGDSSFLAHLEQQGAIRRITGSPTIEVPLDYKRNP